jgi:hypothetical protein
MGISNRFRLPVTHKRGMSRLGSQKMVSWTQPCQAVTLLPKRNVFILRDHGPSLKQRVIFATFAQKAFCLKKSFYVYISLFNVKMSKRHVLPYTSCSIIEVYSPCKTFFLLDSCRGCFVRLSEKCYPQLHQAHNEHLYGTVSLSVSCLDTGRPVVPTGGCVGAPKKAESQCLRTY